MFKRLGIEDTADDYFDRVVENLREGQLRIIFFLENSPDELRSIVDFLNRQTERTEFLIVEARLYETESLRIMVPTVFGYSEQARRVKRKSTTTSNLRLQTLDEFWSKLQSNTGDDECVKSAKDLYDDLNKAGYIGKLGKETLLFRLHNMPVKTVMAIYCTNGRMEMYFKHHPGELLFEKLIKEFVKSDKIKSEIFDENKSYPSIKLNDWKVNVDDFRTVLGKFSEMFKDK